MMASRENTIEMKMFFTVAIVTVEFELVYICSCQEIKQRRLAHACF